MKRNVLVSNILVSGPSVVVENVLVTALARLDVRVASVDHALALLRVLQPEAEDDEGAEADEEHKHGKDVPPVLDIFEAQLFDDY